MTINEFLLMVIIVMHFPVSYLLMGYLKYVFNVLATLVTLQFIAVKFIFVDPRAGKVLNFFSPTKRFPGTSLW